MGWNADTMKPCSRTKLLVGNAESEAYFDGIEHTKPREEVATKKRVREHHTGIPNIPIRTRRK